MFPHFHKAPFLFLETSEAMFAFYSLYVRTS